MKISYLNGYRFFNAFKAGAQAVIKQRDHLNKINVFPVPDADTGNNFATTFQSIIEKSSINRKLNITCQSMSDAAIDGARGNAGIIFSQFFYGFSNEVHQLQRVNAKQFAKSIKAAVSYAYEALSKPVEGTILTVIKDWAEQLHTLSLEIPDFTRLFDRSITAAKKSLLETPNKLKILAKAGVVDAGAQGFVYFLEGVINFIKKGNLSDITNLPTAPEMSVEHTVDIDEDVSFRYCTEALLQGSNIDKNELRKAIGGYGDSLICAGSTEKIHLHIHTNQPAEFYAKVQQFGKISDKKVDDMHAQYMISRHRKSPIALVTDSACDVPSKFIDEYQIQMVPLKLYIDDNLYLDKITMSPGLFYQSLDTTKILPQTSQPSLTDFRNTYSFLASHYESIIAVHLSQALSGTWNISKQAAATIEDTQISVIDSKTLSGALGLIVMRVAEAIDNGKSHEDILRLADEWIAKTKIYVSVPSLKYMVRGGRVSPMKGLLANFFNLKPIVSIDAEGKSTLYGKSFSRSGSMQKIRQYVDEFQRSGDIWNYSIFHANNERHALEYRDQLTALLGKEPAYIMEISPIIGLHAGIGAVAVAIMHP
jgi:DegV family protein with EDD domain